MLKYLIKLKFQRVSLLKTVFFTAFGDSKKKYNWVQVDYKEHNYSKNYIKNQILNKIFFDC